MQDNLQRDITPKRIESEVQREAYVWRCPECHFYNDLWTTNDKVKNSDRNRRFHRKCKDKGRLGCTAKPDIFYRGKPRVWLEGPWTGFAARSIAKEVCITHNKFGRGKNDTGT